MAVQWKRSQNVRGEGRLGVGSPRREPEVNMRRVHRSYGPFRQRQDHAPKPSGDY